MKDLNFYTQNNNSQKLYEAYMQFGERCIYVVNRIDEGNNDIQFYLMYEGLGSWLRKAAGVGDKIDAKFKNMSDSAKKAIEATKKAAGAAWDKVKDVYTKTVGVIDAAIQKTQGLIKDVAQMLGAQADAIESQLADMTMSVVNSGKACAKTVQSWIDDTSDKGVNAMRGLNTLMLGAIAVSKAGLKPQDIVDMINAAAAGQQG